MDDIDWVHISRTFNVPYDQIKDIDVLYFDGHCGYEWECVLLVGRDNKGLFKIAFNNSEEYHCDYSWDPVYITEDEALTEMLEFEEIEDDLCY